MSGLFGATFLGHWLLLGPTQHAVADDQTNNFVAVLGTHYRSLGMIPRGNMAGRVVNLTAKVGGELDCGLFDAE